MIREGYIILGRFVLAAWKVTFGLWSKNVLGWVLIILLGWAVILGAIFFMFIAALFIPIFWYKNTRSLRDEKK